MAPRGPLPVARAAVASSQPRQSQAGRRVRATMWMPQVAVTAHSPSLDSEKDFQAKLGKGSWGHWSQLHDQLSP